VVALARNGGLTLLAEAAGQAKRAGARLIPGADVVAWPAQGAADGSTLFALGGQPVRPVVLDSGALPADARDRDARLDLSLTSRRRRGDTAHPALLGA